MKRLFSVFVAVFLVFGALALSAQTLQDAQKYLYAEQYLNAKKAFQGLVKQAPTAENYYHLGDYYLHVFEVDSVDEYIDTARMHFEKGVSLDAKYALNYVGLGAVKMFQQKKDDAKGYFSNAMQMTKSKDVEVLYRVAEAYVMFNFNDPAAALEVLDIAIKREAKRADLHLLKGDVYLMKNEGGLANSSYDEAIRLAPNKAKGYISSGKVLIRAKNYNGALELYNKGIAAEPDYYPAYRQLGDLYFLANRCKEGIEAYRKYIANSDANLDSRYMYAAFLYLCGDYLEALDNLRELDKVLNKATIHRLISYSCYETKDYDCSIANIEQFFREEKATKVIASDYEYYGKAIMAKGGSEADTLRAIEQFKKAAAKDSVKAEALLFPLGETYYKAKKYAKAAEVLDIIPKYIKNVNSNVYLRQGLAYYFLKTPET
ncbi:MAG: tetratricopeptide repeat protein, partial [Thermoflexibacteraceae bacterium]